MSYERVLEAMVEHNLDWNDIDQIHLSSEAYEDFQERDNRPVSSSSNIVREAAKESDEKIIYIAPNGIEVNIPL